jgi:hypothetical protein
MMQRERKAVTEKGLLKLIERIKNGEALDSQHRIFRGYNFTITKAHKSVNEKAMWYRKFHPDVVEKMYESQRKLVALRKGKGLCIYCGAKAVKKKEKILTLCKKCREKQSKQRRMKKLKK